MPTIEAQIEGALFKRVSELVLPANVSLQWPNEAFDPNPDNPYVIVQHTPNGTERSLVKSSPGRYLGLLMLTVASPIGYPAIDTTDLAGMIAAHFPCDYRINFGSVSIRVTKKPALENGVKSDERWRVPVIIEYECYA